MNLNRFFIIFFKRNKMATPLKLLLSPKVLSPLSPLAHKTGGFFGIPCAQKSLDAAKKIVFTSSKSRENCVKSNIKICISEVIDDLNCTNKGILEINTPNKIEILERGLNEFNFNVLGKGTFGTVVKSVYKGRTVAVKVVKLRENRRRLNESLALDLNHPKIIKIHEIIDHVNNKFAIIVMEYLENFKQLQSIIDQNEWDLTDVTINKYSTDICSAISYCHKNNILHLDIKPRNVLVNIDSGVCKLCDFGNSHRLNYENGDNNYEFHGTVAYAAPELLLGEEPTSKCDIYSFGILLWELIHRENPYNDIKQYELVVYQVVKFNLRPKCVVSNENFDCLYKSCWSKNPQERPSASEILNYLRDLNIPEF